MTSLSQFPLLIHPTRKVQNSSLGSDAELVTVPNAELVGVVFGAAKTGWFSALNASAWNCISTRSRIW